MNKLWTALAVLFFDGISKLATFSYIPLMDYSSPFYPYGGIGIFKNMLGIEFSICYRSNAGAAWGMFAEHQILLMIFRIFLITGLFIYYFFYCEHKEWRWPLALVLAGAVGNVIDYFIYGHVVDMFHFVFWGYRYPVFNIADSAIFIGVWWIIILSLFEKEQTTK
jgi:signal peptidase II